MDTWVILDFIEWDGANPIHDWLHDRRMPVRARAKIQSRLQFVRRLRELVRPYVGRLEGECDGLLEIRVEAGGVAYRPIAYRGPGSRDITLLAGATERDGVLRPLHVCTTAFNRIAQINDEAGHTIEHKYD